MKIGVDARSLLSSSPRGEGKSLLRLYREILALRPHWDIIFFGQGNAATQQPTLYNIRTKKFDLPGFRFNTWENFALPWHAWQERIDVLHCSSSSAPRYSPVPVVMTVHDVIPLVANDGWNDAEIARFKTQLGYGLRSAHRVIAVSQHTKNDLVRIFGVAAERVKVVHWGIDPPSRAAPTELELENLAIRRPFVMVFGGDALRKNTALTIAALAKAAKSLPRLQLVLIGIEGTKARQTYSEQAQQAGLRNVVCLDYVAEQTLEAIYSQTECLVYASLYEGFGLPVLEAMSRGVAVVTSNVSSLPEVAGDAAILVNPRDSNALAQAILAVCSDAQLKQRLRDQGTARAQKFTWHATAAATIMEMEGAKKAN